MSPYEKQQSRSMKQAEKKKSTQQSKGVMSFDDYFNEAPEILDDSSDYSSDGDFWDDDYTWTMDALRHGELKDAQPSQPDSINQDHKVVEKRHDD